MTQERTVRESFSRVVSRWRVLAGIVGCATLLTFVISELLPRRYTSTSTVIVDPPATNDARTAIAMNPTYLESLRTFEHFFTSGTLFLEAARNFHLDLSGTDIETLRRKVLSVDMERGTRILQVSATLPDPAAAKKFVTFITERGIAESLAEAHGADQDMLRNVNAELEQARARFEKAQAEWESAARNDTPDSIQSAVEAGIDLQTENRELEEEAAADANAWQARARAGEPGEREYATAEAQAAAATRNEYAKNEARITAEVTANRKLLAERSGRLTTARAELDSARGELEAAKGRVRDFSAVEGMRSERMRVIDPGVVPRKPSSPKVLLNTLAAALLATCLSVAWLSLSSRPDWRKPAMIRSSQRLA